MDRNRYEGEEFNEFVKELIEYKRLNDSKEEGIAKLVVDKGFESLTEKQKFVFEKSISHYVYDECKRGGCEIPWSEMSAAEVNGNVCGWCQQLGRDDN
ncbi:hypothetical protein FSS13T_03020 [Flavobacterium saliperosum S13]|uniref:Uncharacterized protein n=2 Tax=Flavobacterium saliperosum TaxID=329186 RepID=A0A1G4V567_9FLAO|nr:hypothetical protein [Flavobacterium saliperosum]ESU27823.1 hypothetical protein FSS13T_03020 [Flavobacterium saliperosum S13]SCX01359.1 hypothetical protein SAMN02927925_00317 [Flavobacterium saliperosum]